MSIPAIIHSGLFGRKEYTSLEQFCRESWRRVLVGYRFMEWNGENGPADKNFFVEACARKPINAADYIRFWALNECGGIYLDNDVEILKPFDLTFDAFVSFQRDDTEDSCISTAVFGCIPRHWFTSECLDRIDRRDGETRPPWASCTLPTELLKEHGMDGLNKEQNVRGVHVYSKDFAHPWRWDEHADPMRITNRTTAIHRWGKTWDPTK